MMSKTVVNELFNPFVVGSIRDKSIDALNMYPYYPVSGKNISNYKNNTIRIVTKGTENHYNLADAYLEGVCQITNSKTDPVYAIIPGVNDKFQINGVDVTVPAGYYLTAADLAAAITTIDPDLVVTFAANRFVFTVAVGLPNFQLTATAPNLAAAVALRTLLGFTDAGVVPVSAVGTAINGAGAGPAHTAPAAPAARTNDLDIIMHSNIMSVFRKASLYFNNVMVHSIDYPQMHTTLTWLQDQSQDFNDKRKDLWFYTDATQNYDPADPTQAAKLLITGGAKWFRWEMPLKRLFPFLESYDKLIRGVEIRVELEKNNSNLSEILMMSQRADPTGVALSYKELTMWVPIVVGSVTAEANVISEITAKNSTLIEYSDWANYRRENPAGSEMTWLIDNISEVPKNVYVMCQLSQQLDQLNAPFNANINPATFQNLSIIRAELRINGHEYPKMPYKLIFDDPTGSTADDYTRLYFEWLRVNYKEAEFDNGSLVTYSNFKSIYPIVTFNLSRAAEIQLADNENNVIEVYLQFNTPTPQNYYSWALIEYNAKMKIASNGRQVLFEKM